MAYSDADRLLTVRGTLTYPDTGTQALTSAHISSFLVNEDAGRDVPVGAAPAASFELKLDNSSGQWEPGGSILGAHVLDGAKVEIEIGLWNGAAYDYSDIGTYYVDDVQGQEHETLIRLKGSDAMVSLMSEYYADGAGDYPQTLSSLLTDIAAAAGVTLESSTFTNSTVSIPAQPAWKNNLTCREAVGYIAACAGGIARFNRAGKLEIAPLEKVSSRAVSTSVYKTIQKGDTSFGGLNAINVYAYGAPDGTSPSRYATTPATPDTSLNSINIRDNPILAYGSTALAALGAGMLSALTGLAFRGATFEWHGDPAVELGELCTVTDLSSTAIPILITKQTLRFTSGFSMNSGCAVTTSTKADASGKLQKIFTPTGNLNAEALAGNIYVKAGEKMTLESGGIMNVLSGGEMNIASGGDINVASGGKINLTTANDLMLGAQNITAFADGRIDAKASTIDLSANNSIKLAVSGGTNLIWKTSGDEGAAGRGIWSPSGLMQFAIESTYVLKGCKPTRIFGATGTYALFYTSGLTNHPFVTGDKYTLSFYTYGLSSVSAKISDRDSTNIVINFGALTPKWTKPMMTNDGSLSINYFEVTGTVTGTPSTPVLVLIASAVDDYSRFYCVQLEKGTMATDWSPAPEDPASGVKTSHIDIATDHIDIDSGGTLTLNAADDIKIGSGGDTLASTIDLSANNSIKLAVGGGTNLLQNSGQFSDTDGWAITDGSGNETISVGLSGSLHSNMLTLGNLSVDYTLRSPASKSPIIPGQTYTLSFVFSGNIPSSASVYNNATSTTLSPGLTFPTREPVAGTYYLYKSTFIATAGADNIRARIAVPYSDDRDYLGWIKLEKGTMATDWSPAPSDPASGVKTSYIDIATDHIDISSGGNLSITSPNTLKITSGTTNATALAVRNDTDYFISAGHLTQSSAPFWVKKDGSIKATSGTIGGFTIGTSSLSAQATGKPLLKLDAANSEIILGSLKLFYSGSSEYEFNVGTDELRITASYFGVVGANVFFDVMDGFTWCNGNMSAKSFTDRTPAYTGKNAVAELKLVRNDKNGNIDHSTLPAFARKKITLKDKKSKESEADGRDLGAMISILTKAVQELDERLEKIEDRIK